MYSLILYFWTKLPTSVHSSADMMIATLSLHQICVFLRS